MGAGEQQLQGQCTPQDLAAEETDRAGYLLGVAVAAAHHTLALALR
jgi:hypothetical protein